MLEVAPRRVDRRLLRVLAVGALVVALVLGGLAVLDRARGGAPTPSLLAERVLTALDHEDLPALLRLVEPGEREAVVRLAGAWSDRLVALDLPAPLGGGPRPPAGRGLRGLDLTVPPTATEVTAQADDLAVLDLPGLTVRVQVRPDEASGLLRTWFTSRRATTPSDRTYTGSTLSSLGVPERLVVVRRADRWYLSLLGTVLGPGVADDSTLELAPSEPAPTPTPRAAVEATLRALVGVAGRDDLAALARTLDPSGADAVRLWAAEVAAPETGGRRSEVDTLVTTATPPEHGRAAVQVVALHATGAGEVDLAGSCLTSGGERTCLRRSGYRYDEGLPGLRLSAVLGHDGAFWLTAVEGDGGWRTSLPESIADALAAYADGLTRAQVLALLRRPSLDVPSGVLEPDRAEDVAFTSAGYVLRTLQVERAGLYRVAPGPAGGNRSTVYEADGRPSVQPFYPNDSVYRLDAGAHTVLVWADDAFSRSLDAGGAPYVQRVEVRSVG